MQNLSSTDTINQGRVKINDCIDHTLTGATAGTSPGSIDFKSNSGLYNFTTQINFPNITEGGIIDGMVVTQDATNPLKWNISSGTYMVGGQPYTYAGGGVTLAVGPSAATSPGRADWIIATSAGVTTIQGSANSTTPLTTFYQESSQLPLAVIIVGAGATSTSNPNLIVRSNMNFGGRVDPAGNDIPRHSVNGYNGSNSKMSINMANQGYMNSQYSYIFGGTNNMMSGTSVASTVIPNSGIIGGTSNKLIDGSYTSTIIGSDSSTLRYGQNSFILGGNSHSLQGVAAVLPIQRSFIIGGSSCQTLSLLPYVGFINSNNTTVVSASGLTAINDTSSTIGGGTKAVFINDRSFVTSSTSEFVSANNRTSTTSLISASTLLNNRSIQSTGSTEILALNNVRSEFYGQKLSSFINTQFCTGFTNSGTGNLMLNADYSTISQGVQDSGMILTSYSYLSGSSSNSGIFAGRDSNLNAVNYCATIGGSYNFISASSDTLVTGSENTASTTTFGFISGRKNIISNSAYSTIIGGSGNTITSQGSAIFNCLNTNLNNVSGQVAIATNGYNDSGITLPAYTLITDAHKINKELIVGVEVLGSGTTNTTSKVLQALDVTLGGPHEHNLPASPYDGEMHIIKDAAGTAAGANVLKVQGNGHDIDGAAFYEIDTAYGVLRVVFSSFYNKWLIV